MSAFVSGLLAGYGIAIPVGAVAILIVNTAIAGGFRAGFMAGAGAATADLVYAAIAAVAGAVLAPALVPLAVPLRLASAAVLVILAVAGLVRGLSPRPACPAPGAGEIHSACMPPACMPPACMPPARVPPARVPPAPVPPAPLRLQPGPARSLRVLLRIYAQFTGITLINPLTVIYFTALILGRGDLSPSMGGSATAMAPPYVAPAAAAAFVAGAGLASLSWQTLLAGLGGIAGARLPPNFRRGAVIAGNLVILALAAHIAAGSFQLMSS